MLAHTEISLTTMYYADATLFVTQSACAASRVLPEVDTISVHAARPLPKHGKSCFIAVTGHNRATYLGHHVTQLLFGLRSIQLEVSEKLPQE